MRSQFLLVAHRDETPFVMTDEAVVHGSDLPQQLGMALAEQSHQLFQPAEALPSVVLEHRRRTERQQAHHRAHLQAHRIAVWQLKEVVEEAVLLVPHLVAVVADAIHRIGDPEEMLEKPERHVFVHRIGLGQDQRHFQHVLAVERHPCRPVRLVQMAASRQRRAAIEDPDVVQAEEPAGEHVAPLRVLAVHPPVEIQQQPMERALQEVMSARPRRCSML